MLYCCITSCGPDSPGLDSEGETSFMTGDTGTTIMFIIPMGNYF